MHFICGSTGAGKTTYAMALAQRAKAVCLSIDAWMGGFFVVRLPGGRTIVWDLQRAARCEALMWSVADQVVARGIDVVFDVPLVRCDDRDRFRARASQTAALIKMHYLDVPREVRRARLLARSRKADGGAPPPFQRGGVRRPRRGLRGALRRRALRSDDRLRRLSARPPSGSPGPLSRPGPGSRPARWGGPAPVRRSARRGPGRTRRRSRRAGPTRSSTR